MCGAACLCRYGEKIARMVRGSAEQMYEELFTYACPKFINAAPPTLDAPTANTNQARLRLTTLLICAANAAVLSGLRHPFDEEHTAMPHLSMCNSCSS